MLVAIGALALTMVVGVSTASALKLSVDMDPGTPGIQTTKKIFDFAGPTAFTVDVVVTGDGATLFDFIGLDLAFNHDLLGGTGTPAGCFGGAGAGASGPGGCVVGKGAGLLGPALPAGPGGFVFPDTGKPTAGALAADPGTIDFFSGTPIGDGVGGAFGTGEMVFDFTFPAGITGTAPGFVSGLGGLALVNTSPEAGNAFASFPLIGAGVDVAVFSVDLIALNAGASDFKVIDFNPFVGVGFPLGVTLGGVPIGPAFMDGRLEVSLDSAPAPDPVIPEPTTVLLFGSGLLGLLGYRRWQHKNG